MADHGQPRTYRLPLPRHPPTDSPRITRGRSASASPMRVMRTETWRHVPPRGPTRQPNPLTPGSLLPAFSLPPSLPSLSLSNSKPWRSSPIFPTIEAPPPRRSTTGGHRRTTPTSCTTPIFIFFLGEELPQRVLLPLHLLLQAPSKEDDPELLQAFPDDSKPLPVTHSTPRTQITIDNLELRNPNACAI